MSLMVLMVSKNTKNKYLRNITINYNIKYISCTIIFPLLIIQFITRVQLLVIRIFMA